MRTRWWLRKGRWISLMLSSCRECSVRICCAVGYQVSACLLFCLSFAGCVYAKMVLLRFGSAATDQPCFCTRWIVHLIFSWSWVDYVYQMLWTYHANQYKLITSTSCTPAQTLYRNLIECQIVWCQLCLITVVPTWFVLTVPRSRGCCGCASIATASLALFRCRQICDLQSISE